ncbi:MAG: 2-isopropylmalate synthase, partial [Candidatus Margulisbacteria bacterium]|nr:2-isopropylmalate synthase [Candidatus Margulisiibacteriota bacterium]
SMNIEEKIELAKMLEKLNVDIIEAGFAISSPGDFAAIQAVAKAVNAPIICSLARATKKDIESAAEAIKPAKNKRIHTFIATSPLHMEYKLKMTPEKVLENAVAAVKLAKSFVEDVEFSAEDAGRSEPAFLYKIIEATIKAGATTVNIPDTVGYRIPTEFGKLIAGIRENVPNIDQAVISVHVHNDLGLAVASSIAAIEQGASQVECTINGIGERAGNCSLEEIVMALRVRKDFFGKGKDTNINTKYIYKASRLLTSITGVKVQPNKAIVGANAFAHEAGIHQDGIIKHKQTYEIMKPEDIGLPSNLLVLGKHSGRHAFSQRLKELGYELNDDELNNAFERFKILADKKKNVSEMDLEALVANEIKSTYETYKLEKLHVETGTDVKPTALLKVTREGKPIEVKKTGDGPVDAIFKAIEEITSKDSKGMELLDYVVSAVTEGTDALGEVTVRIRADQKVFTGHGANTDVLVASAEAYINSINKMISFKARKEEPTIESL